MNRRRFIELSALGTTSAALAGCLGRQETEPSEENDTDESAGEEDDDNSDSDPEPEPEGGDGEPFYHYDLDVRDERENGQPVWIDHNERVYGRDDLSVVVSDDWWKTTEELYTFEDEDGRVENVVVPDSGEIIVAVGGQEYDDGGRVYRLTDDHTDHELLYQFDYGRVSNSLNHVTYEDIVLLACYELSDYEEGLHGNEVILSTDGGKSFKKILEPEVNSTEAANNHIHDVEWDPYAERIWVAMGDHGNSQLFWSDDVGESWETVDERGAITMVTQVAAFKDCVTLGSDGSPEGILRWERDGPDDVPEQASDFERVHVQIKTDPDDDTMGMYARRRWHIRENLEEGRELCLMPFGYSPMNDTAEDSVLLASVDGDEWYELHRTETREILLTNVMGPLSMDGECRMLLSDSNQGEGYQIEGTVPQFWD
ncbi:beta propeller repeat protein [Halalkalicoccus subterraneus]|uniref:glycosyl hydrolase n=1 Tax=Halalkalicoccus subterraneus TaxID=2675002 RepID=UPI000EFBDFB3|nr:glycosyl hydrolase [Halalkalicoccus subterraneus]